MAQIIFLLFFWSLGYYGTIYFNEIKLVSVALMPYVCYLDPLYSAVSGVLLLCSLVVSRFKKRRKKVEPRKIKHDIDDGINFYHVCNKKETERMNENEIETHFKSGNGSGSGPLDFVNGGNLEFKAVWPMENKIDELLAIARKEPVPVTLSNVPTWIDASKYSPTVDGEYLTIDSGDNIYKCVPFKNGEWDGGSYRIVGWLPKPVTGDVKDKIQVVNTVQETLASEWQPISEFDKDSVDEKDIFVISISIVQVACKFEFGVFKNIVTHCIYDNSKVTHFLKLPQVPQEKEPEPTTIELATLSQEKQDAIRKIMNT